MGKNVTTEDFIKKAKAIHGDKYDYSLVDYKSAKAKVIIVCKEHGEFLQAPTNHLQGKGCKVCAGVARLTRDIFIERATQVHGNKYDYTLVDDVNTSSKLSIGCEQHGVFIKTPHNHLNGQGCPKCSHENMGKKTRLSTEDFIQRANLIHSGKYDYSKVDYQTGDCKVLIICPNCGEFSQTAVDHLAGRGCMRCKNKSTGDRCRKNVKDFIKQCIEVHGDKYDYSLVQYKNTRTDVDIICPTHGVFKQVPISHIRGSQCPSCSKTGFDPSKSAIVYYLRIERRNFEPVYKIGITNRTVDERFKIQDLQKITVVSSWEYQNGSDALAKEKEILNIYKEFKYVGEPILDSGNTELFIKDVLQLDDNFRFATGV